MAPRVRSTVRWARAFRCAQAFLLGVEPSKWDSLQLRERPASLTPCVWKSTFQPNDSSQSRLRDSSRPAVMPQIFVLPSFLFVASEITLPGALEVVEAVDMTLCSRRSWTTHCSVAHIPTLPSCAWPSRWIA
jgi:hypothetical protein